MAVNEMILQFDKKLEELSKVQKPTKDDFAEAITLLQLTKFILDEMKIQVLEETAQNVYN